MTGSEERFGSYRIVRTLARKPAGRAVHVAVHDGAPEREVVLKVMPGMAGGDEAMRARFEHEAELMRAIDHPRIVRVLEAGAAGEDLFIATELVDGVTFSTLFDEVQLEPAVVVGLMIMVLEALEGLHGARDPKHGVLLEAVHRDLSPGNIMVDRSGEVHIIDLGLGSSLFKTWRTATGMVFGTPGYIAPEHVRGGRSEARGDLYAAAVITFELLTGTHYIPRAPMVEMLVAIAQKRPVEPSLVRPSLPRALDEVVMKALSPEPEGRYPTARALADALRTAVTPAPPGAIAGAVSRFFAEEAPDPAPAGQRTARARVGPAFSGRIVALSSLAAFVGAFTAIAVLSHRPAQPNAALDLAAEPRLVPAPRASQLDAPAPTPPAGDAPRIRPGARRTKPPPTELETPEAPLEVDFETRLRRFTDRAKRLKAVRPELGAEVNRLLTESVMWSYASDPERAQRGLTELEQRLLALEEAE